MRRDDELLAAYVDGVSELTTDERRRIEELLARDPALRTDAAQTRTLIDRLRSLAPEGTEPDWAAMERAIASEAGPTVPRAWWRPSWRWLVPASALALAAAVLALWLGAQAPAPAPVVAAPHDAGAPPSPPPSNELATLWLDGEEVEVELDADELLEVDRALLGEDDSLSPGLLPVDNLAWIDELDADDIEVAEAWLGRKKG